MAVSSFTTAGATDEGALSVKSYTLTPENAKIIGPFSPGVYSVEVRPSMFNTIAVDIELYSYIGTTPTLLGALPVSATATAGTYAGATKRSFTLTSSVDGFVVPGGLLPVTLIIKKFETASSGGLAYVPNISNPNFTSVALGQDGYSISFAFKGNTMAYGCYSGYNAISNDDGATWGLPLNGSYSVAITDSVVVYVQGGTNSYYTIPLGTLTGTARSFGAVNPNPYGGNKMAYGNGVLVMFSSGTFVMTTDTNAISWTTTTGLAFTADAVCFDGTRFLATATTNVYSSTNGVSWTLISTTKPAGHQDIYFGQGMYLVTPNSAVSTYYTSTDLITWTSRTNPFGSNNIDWAVYRNGAWAMGRYGTVSVGSYDGLTWTTLTGTNATYQGGINNTGRFYIWQWGASYIHYSQNRNGIIV